MLRLIFGVVLLGLMSLNSAYADQQVVVVCDPNCHEVVIVTFPDSNDPMGQTGLEE